LKTSSGGIVFIEILPGHESTSRSHRILETFGTFRATIVEIGQSDLHKKSSAQHLAGKELHGNPGNGTRGFLGGGEEAVRDFAG